MPKLGCLWLLGLGLTLLACQRAKIPGVQAKMDFSRHGDFFAAPFPSLDLQASGGHYDLADFPNREGVDFLAPAFGLIEDDLVGASLSSAIYFQFDADIDHSLLPDIFASTKVSSPVFLMNVESGSPDYLVRHPIDVEFRKRNAGPYGTRNQLSLLPLQGLPLRANSRYAAVVLRQLGDREGHLLGVGETMMQLVGGGEPEGLSPEHAAAYREAIDGVVAAGVRRGNIAALAVFETGDPKAQTRLFRQHALDHHLPNLDREVVLNETFGEFCVFHTTVLMPVYQDGNPNYLSGGGRFRVDANGDPVLQDHHEANVWVTVPRTTMPQTGFPLAVFVRTGGGGDRPLVDRGTGATAGYTGPIEPGTGPALFFARAGFAGISIDGPHGGLRNPNKIDEQLLIFNFFNPAALRDNIRQSALELSLIPHMLADWDFVADTCAGLDTPGGNDVHFDLDRLALMGHSTGATIAPLVVFLEPRFAALILSGAGGSYIQNIMEKQSPFAVRPFAEEFMGYKNDQHLYAHEPILSIVQWAAEPADPVVYARQLVREPEDDASRHVLMLQGIVDTYILPPIANAASVSLGLDFAGPTLDAEAEQLSIYRPLAALLPLSGGSRLQLPVQGNILGGVTAVVIQHLEDGVQDGHEVVFQLPEPKYQYQCFLNTLKKGIPLVPAGEDPQCE